MKRNTLILITGVLLFGGLFGLTATATAADTAGPADFSQNINVDPGEEDTANNFTFMANHSQSTDTNNISAISANFSQASGVNASQIGASQVTVNANNTTTGVASLSTMGEEELVISLTSNFTLNEVDTYVNVSVNDVMVPANGTFDGNLSFWSSGMVVANHTSTYTIAQAPTLSLNFSDQEPSNGNVTVNNVSSDGVQATVALTYYNGTDDIIVGQTTGTFADESVQITLGSTAGFPGMHTAHIIETADISSNTTNTGVVSNATASAVQDSQQANVSIDVGNDGNLARDMTGDSLLNDINGDMAFDILDIQALFMNLGSQEFASYPGYFDFSGSADGEVDIFDVQALYGWYANPPAP